ncbi:MAG: hypothetical protein QOH81_3512 [Sphingomonadales bacterium]|nr:hypothetical protein [Sphingomonadales bacterium]
MFRRMTIALLLAAPGAAAFGQGQEVGGQQEISGQGQEMGDWAIAQMPNGCMVEAVSPQGTMLSIWGFAGQPKLAFLLQNKGWGALQDGRSYKLGLDFVGTPTAMPVDATAREHIDSDGPGFLFTVVPGGDKAKSFLTAFTSAEGMRISRDGRSVDTLPLAGSRGAIGALAKCLAGKWGAAGAEPDASDGDDAKPAPAVPTA